MRKRDNQKETGSADVLKPTLKNEKMWSITWKKVAEQDPCNKAETQRMANKMRENNDG